MTDEQPDCNVRGPLLVIRAQMRCWKCFANTTVAAFAGQADTEAWVDDADPPRWLPLEEPMALNYVAQVPDSVAARARNVLPTLRQAHGQSVELGYWINHCEHCDAPIGDHYTQSHPDGPFFAWPRDGRQGIEIITVGAGEVRCSPPYIIPPEQRSPRRRRSKKESTSSKETQT